MASSRLRCSNDGNTIVWSCKLAGRLSCRGDSLFDGDFVSEAQCDTLRLTADANEPANFTIRLLLDADVGECVLTEHTLRVEIRR